MPVAESLPDNLEFVRKRALKTLEAVQPAGPPRSDGEGRALMLASRTDAGRSLPEYYLVYFLLVDLLGYQNLGEWEKVAWAVPVRYKGRLYSIEHRKLGVGVFAPTHDPSARMSARPSAEAEADAQEIVLAIKKAISVARPYFEWRASEAASTSHVNVVNRSSELFDRYVYFRDRFQSLHDEAVSRKDEHNVKKSALADGTVVTTSSSPAFALNREAAWNAQAAIDAFFTWTEHAFIHIAILQGHLRTGDEVAALAKAEWKEKFKAAIDVSQDEMKQHYDRLVNLRLQIRNFMAHGAFGKNGEAFRFHSGAGAVPVLLSRKPHHRYALVGAPAFDEAAAIAEIEAFAEHLWSGMYSPAKAYVFSHLPSILTHAADGTYKHAMQSDQEMAEFVDYLEYQVDRSANMDW